MKQNNNIQNLILSHCRSNGIHVTIYLNSGMPLKGKIIVFDLFTILIENEKNQSFLIYKHSISTITPHKSIHVNKLLESNVDSNDSDS